MHHNLLRAAIVLPGALLPADGQTETYVFTFSRGLTGCPEVGFWAVTTPSGVFEPEVVVHGLAQFLLATQIPLRCLNRYVS